MWRRQQRFDNPAAWGSIQGALTGQRKETNIIENWNESRDEKGRVIRALGRID